MSYRAFKRLLGETSLERKCRYLLGTVSLVLIFCSFWFYARQTEEIAYQQTAKSGQILVPLIVRIQHDKMLFGRETVAEFQKRSEQNRKAMEELQKRYEENRKAMDEFQAGSEKEWSDALRDYSFAFIKPYSRNLANRPEPDEIGIVERLIKDPDRTGYSQQQASGEKFLYYGAVRARPVCLNCHGKSPEDKALYGDVKDGSLMAVVRVTLSGPAVQQEFHLNRAIMLAFALGTSFLIMTVSYLMIRYVIVKPVKHLKDVSDAIAAGELNVRSEIQTGDEFEDLSHAFNRMLRNLMSMQEQLKGANVELDHKVDELAQTNLALYESNRLKSDFLATMSHELRTPLNSVLGFSDLLLSNPQLPEKMRRWAGNIQSSGKQLLALINDLLDLAKIEAGKMEVKPEAVSLADMADGLLTMHRPLAEKKNIDVRAVVEPDLPPARQDPGKLRQILSNLLSNAIKFTPEGGRVQLRAEAVGADLVLTVTDTGVGIAVNDQALVFEKFRQAASPMTREYEGTGLGLSIVRELSKLLGGDVTLESEVGRGSTFTVRLPMELKDAPQVVYEPTHLADGPDLATAAVVG
jgi:two-component system sensor histidine kinase BarA